jgi:hypothetical protein
MPSEKAAGLRKRQQIAGASQKMFIAVAIASAIVGAAVVLSFTLVQKLVFNEKVLAAKEQTANVLQKNTQVAPKLIDNLRVLNTNQTLKNLETQGDTEPVQVVLDALPSTPNSAALGASLQSSQLLGQSGVSIQSLVVNPASSEASDGSSSSDSSGDANSIQFTFTISVDEGSASTLKSVLQSLENSIRTINLTNVTLQNQGSTLTLMAQGEGYYQPAQTISLQDKAVKP